MKWLDKRIGKLNLYERNIYQYVLQYVVSNRGILGKAGAFLYARLNKIWLHNIFLNYVEVPITTKCSLKCKECSNLIQFYNKSYHAEWEKIVKDIYRLSRIVDGIGMLRILGGEPLLHPHLVDIIEAISSNAKIKHIQIVTNGTLLCNEKLIDILVKNKKVSVDISFYKDRSINYGALIRQLKANGVVFYSNKNLTWTEQSNCKYRHRKGDELENVFGKCKLDCISMLNGQLHICPRSSHGMDLNLIPRRVDEYIDLRSAKSIKLEKQRLYKLLNVKAISACNYCDVFRWRSLKKCVAGEQVSKEKASQIYNEVFQYNRRVDKV